MVLAALCSAQKRQAPNLGLDVPPLPGAACCLDIRINKFDQSVTADILGGEVAKKISVWPAYLKNNSTTDTLRVSESDVLSRITNLSPYDNAAMELFLDHGQLINKWAIAGRLVQDLGFALLLPVVGDLIKTGTGLKNAVAAFVSSSPYILSRLNSRVIPSRTNWGRLGWKGEIDIPPGGSVIVHIATIRWDINPSEPMRIRLDTQTGNLVRTIR